MMVGQALALVTCAYSTLQLAGVGAPSVLNRVECVSGSETVKWTTSEGHSPGCQSP